MKSKTRRDLQMVRELEAKAWEAMTEPAERYFRLL